MEAIKEPTLEDIQKPKTLTREQKRMIEKIQEEAQKTFQDLADRYLKAFLDSDSVDSDELKATGDHINYLWQTYVKRRKLDPKANVGMKQYIDDVLKDYNESKASV